MSVENAEPIASNPLYFLIGGFVAFVVLLIGWARWENWRAKNSKELRPVADSGKE